MDLQRTNIPQWVTINDADIKSDSGESSRNDLGSVKYLLLDTQINLSDQSLLFRFKRFVVKINSIDGINALSPIQIQFYPNSQTIKLNKIIIYRENNIIDKFPSSRIEFIQRETDLENQIYDGSKTLAVFIDDLRANDVVDYAYTIEDTNPDFKNNFYNFEITQWEISVNKIHFSIIVPQSVKPLFNLKSTPEPEIENYDNNTKYSINIENTEVIELERYIPGDFIPVSYLEVSTFKDWNFVATEVTKVFDYGKVENESLLSEMTLLKDSCKNESDISKLSKAVNFVQKYIRYLSIEIGNGTYKPANPGITFDRKYGDCKDKSVLLHYILTELNIESYPLLVNTALKGEIINHLPTPYIFNHCIVLAKTGGKSYHIDPSISYQATDIENISEFDYSYGLIVSPASNDLYRFQSVNNNIFKKFVTEKFDLTGNLDSPVEFEVETISEFHSAVSMRNLLAKRPRNLIIQDNVKYYSHLYPGIKNAGVFETDIDENKNIVTTKEKYEISNFWRTHPDKEGFYQCDIVPLDIKEFIFGPDSLKRKFPLEIPHPVDISLRTMVYDKKLEDFPIKNNNIECKYFSFTFNKICSDGTYQYYYNYKSLKNKVEPEDIEMYYNKVKEIRSLLGYIFTKDFKNNGFVPSPEPKKLTSLHVFIIFIISIIIIRFLAGVFGN